MDFSIRLGSLLQFLALLSVCVSQELSFCPGEKNNKTMMASNGKLQHSGTEDMCVCFLKDPNGAIGNQVDVEIEMSLEDVSGEEGSCFPRLGLKESKFNTPYYSCPEKDATKSVYIIIPGTKEAMLQISNPNAAEFIAEVQFSTSPKVELEIRCTRDNQVDSWGDREEGIDFGESNRGGTGGNADENREPDTVAIAVGITVAVLVIAAIVIVIVIFMKRLSKKKTTEKEMENKTDAVEAENPAYHPDNAPPPVNAAPATYSNVNLNPNPNSNPMTKQASVGNLSTASSVSSIGVPDMGAGAIHSAGAQPPMRPPPPQQLQLQQQQPPPQHMQQQPPPQHYQQQPPQEAVHTQI